VEMVEQVGADHSLKPAHRSVAGDPRSALRWPRAPLAAGLGRELLALLVAPRAVI